MKNRMKSILALLISITMLITPSMGSTWYTESQNNLKESGLEWKFAPSRQMTYDNIFHWMTQLFNLKWIDDSKTDITFSQGNIENAKRVETAGYLDLINYSKLDLSKNITKAEAIALLAIAKGLTPQDEYMYLKQFKDYQRAPSWTKPYLEAAIRAGYISGSKIGDDKYLYPTQIMLEREAYVVFDKFIGKNISKSGTYKGIKQKGNLSVLSKGVKLSDCVIEGDLWVGAGATGTLLFENVFVTGKIYIQPSTKATLYLNGVTADKAIIGRKSAKINAYANKNSSIEQIYSYSDATIEETSYSISGFEDVYIAEGINAKLKGKFKTVSVNNGNINLENASLFKLNTSKDVEVELDKNSEITSVIANGNLTITGLGEINAYDQKSGDAWLEGDIKVIDWNSEDTLTLSKDAEISTLRIEENGADIVCENGSVVKNLYANRSARIKGTGKINYASVNASDVHFLNAPTTLTVATANGVYVGQQNIKTSYSGGNVPQVVNVTNTVNTGRTLTTVNGNVSVAPGTYTQLYLKDNNVIQAATYTVLTYSGITGIPTLTPQGMLLAYGTGSVTIRATDSYGRIKDAVFTVGNVNTSVAQLTINTSNGLKQLDSGGTTTLKAYENGKPQVVKWSVKSYSGLSAAPEITPSGEVFARGFGTVCIEAENTRGAKGKIVLGIGGYDIERGNVLISKNTSSIDTTLSTNTATQIYATIGGVVQSVTWEVRNPKGVSAQITSAGIITATGVGTVEIVATFSDLTEKATTFTVGTAVGGEIQITAPAATITSGETTQLTASYNGSPTTVTWQKIGETGVSGVSLTTDGKLTATGNGTVTVKATDSEGRSGIQIFTIKDTTNALKIVSHGNVTAMANGSTLQLNAYKGTTLVSVTWSVVSGNATVANGLVTATGTGPAVIRATYGSETADFQLTIN